MDSSSGFDLPVMRDEANVLTRRKHRNEFWWQILFPILIIFILIGLGAYYLISGNSASIGSMAQIGTMLMLIPLILIALLLILITMALIYALLILMKWLPPNTYWLQNQIMRFNKRAEQAADMAAEPILRFDSWSKALRKTFERFF